MGMIKAAAEADKTRVGDCVLLSRDDSAQILKVNDIDGRQIRLDGTVITIAGDWCRVLITLERRSRQFNMPPVHISMQTRLRDVDRSTTAHCWAKLTAMAIDRRRRTGSNDCEFWANF